MAIFLLGSLVIVPGRVFAQVQEGQFLDEVVFEDGGSLSDVSSGGMQLSLADVRGPDIDAALADPNVRTVVTPGTVDDLYINPFPQAPAVGGYNPFSIREVREAIHWLVDRDLIVDRILNGGATSVISPFHPLWPEYLRQVLFFQALDRAYAYNAVKARHTIFSALDPVPGITFGTDGKWRYRGALLTVRVIIPAQDNRRDIGNYVADQLETLGFTVDREYTDQPRAYEIVYYGPPEYGAWHIYIERFPEDHGLIAWDDGYFATHFLPFYPDYPLDAFSRDPALIEAALRLETARYRDAEERGQLVRTASTLAMKESIRIPLEAAKRTYISNKAVSIAYDLEEGPLSLFTIRSARFGVPGGQMRVGVPFSVSSQWNPVRGFWWPYDRAQFRAMSDPGVATHPHLGSILPIRGAFTVTASGGNDALPLDVPVDAIWFNVSRLDWQTVGNRVTAISKVSWDFTFGKWHTGISISMSDVLYRLSRYYRSYNETYWGGGINPITGEAIHTGDIGNEPGDRRAASPEVVKFLSLFKGAKVTGPNTIDIYLDYWHVDPGMIAAEADVFPQVPWEVEETMVQVVEKDNLARYDSTSAVREGKVLMDLHRGPSLPLLRNASEALRAANEIPPGMTMMIGPAEASARWAALDAFSTSKTRVIGQAGYTGGQFLVSNGPAFLETVDLSGRQAILKRFSGYPYPADVWDKFLVLRVPSISVGLATAPGLEPGEVVPGLAALIPIETRLLGQPYDLVTLDYSIVNPLTGAVPLQGKPTWTGLGSWTIELSANETLTLLPGSYVVQVVAVGLEAAVPRFASGSVHVTSMLALYEGLLQRLESDLRKEIREAANRSDIADRMAYEALDRIQSLTMVVRVTTALSIGSIGIALVSLVVHRGRKRPT